MSSSRVKDISKERKTTTGQDTTQTKPLTETSGNEVVEGSGGRGGHVENVQVGGDANNLDEEERART